jgi:hypothetical protein
MYRANNRGPNQFNAGVIKWVDRDRVQKVLGLHGASGGYDYRTRSNCGFAKHLQVSMKFLLNSFSAAAKHLAVDAARHVQPRVSRADYGVRHFVEEVADFHHYIDHCGGRFNCDQGFGMLSCRQIALAV